MKDAKRVGKLMSFFLFILLLFSSRSLFLFISPVVDDCLCSDLFRYFDGTRRGRYYFISFSLSFCFYLMSLFLPGNILI